MDQRRVHLDHEVVVRLMRRNTIHTALVLALVSCGGPPPPEDTSAEATDTEDTGSLDVDDDGDGLTENEGDCDDADPDISPAEDETPYDGIDNDCDPLTPDDDLDGDGFDVADDCDDDVAAINPVSTDIVGDDIDQNCDGIDGTDADGDGHASEASGGDDCDDADATISPSAPEVWYDGIDQQCDGVVDDDDQDGDGYESQADAGGDDCDDTDPLVHPLGVEDNSNGIDDNCNGTVDGFKLHLEWGVGSTFTYWAEDSTSPGELLVKVPGDSRLYAQGLGDDHAAPKVFTDNGGYFTLSAEPSDIGYVLRYNSGSCWAWGPNPDVVNLFDTPPAFADIHSCVLADPTL